MTVALPHESSTALQRTPLFGWHQSHGAKMVDFSGWEMPLQYGKVLEEHAAVRQAAGLFDISHMGLLLVEGELNGVRSFLDQMVPQELSALREGKAVYTQLLNETGGILDDVIVYQLPQTVEGTDFTDWTGFLVIVNAGNRQVALNWLNAHAPKNIQVRLASQAYGLLALQGPRFAEILARLGCPAISLPPRFWLAPATLQPKEGEPAWVLLSRTGYTGEDGVELIVEGQHIQRVWDAILKTGNDLGCKPIGLAARDTLRLEAAYPLHGHDIHPGITPLEAGLGWSVRLQKPGDFMGKAALLNPACLKQQAVCLALEGRNIPRQHDKILSASHQVIGEITSGSISPTLGKPIAMGVLDVHQIKTQQLAVGSALHIEIRGKVVEATWVKRPFYSRVKG